MMMKNLTIEEKQRILSEYQSYCEGLEDQNNAQLTQIITLREYIENQQNKEAQLKMNEKQLKKQNIKLNGIISKLQKQLEGLKHEQFNSSQQILNIISQIFLQNKSDKSYIARNTKKQIQIKFQQPLKLIKSQLQQNFLKKLQSLKIQLSQEFNCSTNSVNCTKITLENQLALEKDKVQHLQNRLGQSEKYVQNLQQQLSANVKEKNILKLLHQEIQVASENHDFVNLQQMNPQIHKIVSEKDFHLQAEITRTEKVIRSTVRKEKQFQREIQNKKEEIDKLKSSVNHLKNENSEMLKVIQNKDSVIKGLNIKIESLEGSESILKSDQTRVKIEIQEFLLFIQENIKEMKKVTKEKQEYKSKVQILEKSNFVLRQKILEDIENIGKKEKHQKDNNQRFKTQNCSRQYNFNSTRSQALSSYSQK